MYTICMFKNMMVSKNRVLVILHQYIDISKAEEQNKLVRNLAVYFIHHMFFFGNCFEFAMDMYLTPVAEFCQQLTYVYINYKINSTLHFSNRFYICTY